MIVDGCCLDEEGAIWFADIKGCRVVRVAEGGEILDVIPAPEGQNVFACMLGGDDGRTLLMCVAPGMRDNDRLGTWRRLCGQLKCQWGMRAGLDTKRALSEPLWVRPLVLQTNMAAIVSTWPNARC